MTGRTPGLRHRGNVTAATAEAFTNEPPLRGEVAPALPAGPDTSRYPRATSDIVALLMHDHQIHVHNVLCTANQESRIALYRWPAMRELLQLPADSAPSGSYLVVLNSQAEKVLEALLCKGEAAFPADGIQGRARSRRRTRAPDAPTTTTARCATWISGPACSNTAAVP